MLIWSYYVLWVHLKLTFLIPVQVFIWNIFRLLFMPKMTCCLNHALGWSKKSGIEVILNVVQFLVSNLRLFWAFQKLLIYGVSYTAIIRVCKDCFLLIQPTFWSWKYNSHSSTKLTNDELDKCWLVRQVLIWIATFRWQGENLEWKTSKYWSIPYCSNGWL